MSYKAIYTYAWDLAETGVAAAAKEFRDLGLDTVTIAGSYHAGKFMRPHGKAGKVYFPDDGTVYFNADPSRYGHIKPVANRLLGERDVLQRTRRDGGMAVNVWLVLLHNTRLGMAHPDAVVRNAFGDPYYYNLCPSAPDARAYAIGLATDVTKSYPVGGISIEAPGFTPYAHGYHHEFALMKSNPWLENMLGLCFCEHCVAGRREGPASTRGASRRKSRPTSAPISTATSTILPIWPRRSGAPTSRPTATCAAISISATASSPRWSPKSAAAVRPDANVAVIPSVARPTGGAWYEGSDLGALAETTGIIEACFYEPSAMRVKADLFDIRRRLRGAGKLRGILRPSHPDMCDQGRVPRRGRGASRRWRRRTRLLQLGPSAPGQPGLDRGRDARCRMSQQFAGKTVAITGAAGGIGQWLCRFFGAEGATIAALDRNDKVNALVETLGKDGITVKAAVADITSAKAVEAAFAGFGDVHLLINNAGVSGHPTLASTDPASWDEDIAANLNGAYACAHAVLPQMVARRSGAIVNVGSVNGLSALGDPAYSAAKAGMIAMTKALAMEYGRYGIRTNCVLPGTVRTPIWDKRKAKDPERAEKARALVSARPHRRTGRSGPGHRLSCI